MNQTSSFVFKTHYKTFINYKLAMWISFSYIVILVVYAHINAIQTNNDFMKKTRPEGLLDPKVHC